MSFVRRPSVLRLTGNSGRIISTVAELIVNFEHCLDKEGGQQ